MHAQWQHLRATLIAVVSLVLCALSVSAAGQQSPKPPTPTFKVDLNTFTLPPGAKFGHFDLVLSATGFPADVKSPPTLTDIGEDDTVVTFAPTLISNIGDTRTWHVAAFVKSMPLNVERKRHLRITFDHAPIADEIAYTISNTYPSQFDWSLTKPADKAVWHPGQRLSFYLRIGAVDAHNVRILQTGLVDSRTGELFDAAPSNCGDNTTACKDEDDDGDNQSADNASDRANQAATGPLLLCDAPAPHCDGHPLTLEANKNYQLYLMMNGSPWPGKYTSNLALVADEKTAGEALAVELSVTSLPLQLWGCVVIFIGILGALVIGPFNRARISRDQALRPAILLREHIEALRDRMTAAYPGGFKAMRDSLRHAYDSLAQQQLDQRKLLPPQIPLYYSQEISPASVTTYQNLLDDAAKRLNIVTMIFERGILPAIRMPHDPAQAKAITDTVERLDKLADAGGPDLDDLPAKIDAELETLAGALSDGRSAVARMTVDEAITTKRIDFELQALNLLGWLTFSVLSLLVGSLVLVFSNPAFGTCYDFILCLLWGFGLPAAGQQLSAVNSPAIGSTLGISLAK